MKTEAKSAAAGGARWQRRAAVSDDEHAGSYASKCFVPPLRWGWYE